MNLRVRVRRVIATVVATVAIGALALASASSLGGVVGATLLAGTAAATPTVPAVAGCDDFSKAASTGTALVSRPVQLPAACGAATWTVHLGTWTISAGQLGAATANATASIATGSLTNMTAQTTILNTNATGRTAGVAVDHTGATRTFLLAIVTGGNTVTLQLSNAGTISTITSVAVTLTASTVLRLTRNGTAVTVSVDGVSKIAATLTAGQVTTLSSGTRAGLYWNAGSTVRFTNFLVTQPFAP